MADSYTQYYNLTKVDVGGSRDTWGPKLNDNVGIIDAALHSHDEGIAARLQRLEAKMAGFVGGDKTKPFIRHTDDADILLATQAALATRVPAGSIILWAGAANAIPTGWALCDGTQGTPDLRNRFVVGAGAGYAVGATGGAQSHDHGGNSGATALSISQIPAHSHGVNDPGHSHGVYDPGHVHSYADRFIQVSANRWNAQVGNDRLEPIDVARNTNAAATGISIAGAGTGISLQNNGGGAGHSHPIAAADHRPPYFALCYIMKL